MSSIHNDLATWAGRAAARGNDTIVITTDIAIKASEAIVTAATEIEALRRENQELRAAVIEECAKVAQKWKGHPADFHFAGRQIAAAIRALTMSDIHREQLDRPEGLCPRPCNDRAPDFSMRDCIEAGECGCIAFPASAAEKELRAERDLLQDILDTRPAINAGLPETYIRWSQSIYSGDAIRAALRPDRREAE